jgi:hypothetical protein
VKDAAAGAAYDAAYCVAHTPYGAADAAAYAAAGAEERRRQTEELAEILEVTT